MLKKGSIITFIMVVVLTGIIYLVALITPEPPIENLKKARKVLAGAKKQGAEKYAMEEYEASATAYQQAVDLWESENKRFIIFRDYSSMDSCCTVAINLADKATSKSYISSRNLEVSLEARIHELQSMVEKYTPLLNSMPVPKATRERFLSGKMELSEATLDFGQKQFIEGDKKALKANQNLSASISEVNILLENYFKSYPDWLDWYYESVQKSKMTHSSLIVIDKMARICKLYKNGKVKKIYSIELGRNWIGDKRHQGDKSTPEGRYQVVKKLDSGHSKFYKALLINYPNVDDRLRFKQEIQKGNLPMNAEIGGMIEIHGRGGKGADWTDGCIALKDEDMKELYKLTDVSTPVTIVGSLVALNILLSN